MTAPTHADHLQPSRLTFVLVHGAFHGGWCYGRVADILRAAGHRVFTPTLTGLGERSNLFSPAINASTHVRDVLDVPRFEELDDVVLAAGALREVASEQLGDGPVSAHRVEDP